MNAYQESHFRTCPPDRLLGQMVAEWTRWLSGYSEADRYEGERWFRNLAVIAEERGLGYFRALAKQRAHDAIRDQRMLGKGMGGN